MKLGKKYENAHTCSFFGEIKEKELTREIYAWLRLVLEDMIRVKNVKIFYTTSKTDFDFICESIVLYLQHKYPDVLLIKYVSKKYKHKAIDNRYSDIVHCDFSDYYLRCFYVGGISEYVIFDKVSDIGITSEALLGHMIKGRDISRGYINLIPFIQRYDKTVEDAKKQSEELLERRKNKQNENDIMH